VDSRISALITAGTKVFLPLPQFSHGAEKLETKDFPETQMFRPLDIFKPYQRLAGKVPMAVRLRRMAFCA
jgi:hypothetical protein